MFIIFGTSLYGRTDQFRDSSVHVATRFVHVYMFPILPVGSYLVLSGDGVGGTGGGQFEGVRIGWSFKSILITWLRLALAIGALALVAIGAGNSRRPDAWMWHFSAGAALVAFVATYLLPAFRYASHQRARALAQRVGMNEAAMIHLDAAYGVITPEEAEMALLALEEDEAGDGAPSRHVPQLPNSAMGDLKRALMAGDREL